MAGNVAEWTADWFQAHSWSDVKDDRFGEKYKVCRGGSWYTDQDQARCANRFPPRYHVGVLPDINIGFRCVWPLGDIAVDKEGSRS